MTEDQAAQLVAQGDRQTIVLNAIEKPIVLISVCCLVLVLFLLARLVQAAVSR